MRELHHINNTVHKSSFFTQNISSFCSVRTDVWRNRWTQLSRWNSQDPCVWICTVRTKCWEDSCWGTLVKRWLLVSSLRSVIYTIINAKIIFFTKNTIMQWNLSKAGFPLDGIFRTERLLFWSRGTQSEQYDWFAEFSGTEKLNLIRLFNLRIWRNSMKNNRLSAVCGIFRLVENRLKADTYYKVDRGHKLWNGMHDLRSNSHRKIFIKRTPVRFRQIPL